MLKFLIIILGVSSLFAMEDNKDKEITWQECIKCSYSLKQGFHPQKTVSVVEKDEGFDFLKFKNGKGLSVVLKDSRWDKNNIIKITDKPEKVFHVLTNKVFLDYSINLSSIHIPDDLKYPLLCQVEVYDQYEIVSIPGKTRLQTIPPVKIADQWTNWDGFKNSKNVECAYIYPHPACFTYYYPSHKAHIKYMLKEAPKFNRLENDEIFKPAFEDDLGTYVLRKVNINNS
ncbi:MAG: hypothetical protein ACTSXG_03860 [Alphaproteobacteria bacterium]